MARVTDCIEFGIRETVIGIAGAISLHADRNRPPGDPNFPPRPERDSLASGLAALTAVGLLSLAIGRRTVCGLLPRRRSAPAKAARPGRRI